jgi:hypothetical protein
MTLWNFEKDDKQSREEGIGVPIKKSLVLSPRKNYILKKFLHWNSLLLLLSYYWFLVLSFT